MKYVTMFFLCTMLVYQGFAQEAEKTFNRNEIGLNATTFIANFLSLSSDSPNPGHYLLNYRLYSTPTKAFRVGFNLNVANQNEKIDFNTDQAVNSQLLNLRIGWERQVHIKQRWGIMYGFDVLFNYDNRTINTTQFSDFVKSSTRMMTSGIGPYLGVQFNINDRIGLFTESTFYFTYNQERSEDVFSNFPNESISDKVNSFAFNSTFPTAIFFFVKF